MSASKLCGWLALAGWMGAAGCGGEEPAAEREPCTDRTGCHADPVAHWVCQDDCRTDADCPGGFVCVQHEGDDAKNGKPSCEPPLVLQAPTAALIEGFGVAEMAGKLEPVMQAEGAVTRADFAWKAPAGARVVQCALFVCVPVIEARRIVNYDQCVIAEETYAQREGLFSLYDEDVQSPVPTAGVCDGSKAPDDDTMGRFPVTELLVGCWAYDERGMVAATELERPRPAQIFDYHGIFGGDGKGNCAAVGDGEKEELGRSCSLEDGTFGVCRAEGCARRCLRDEDCVAASETAPLDICSPLEDSWAGRACPVPLEMSDSTGTDGSGDTTDGGSSGTTGAGA